MSRALDDILDELDPYGDVDESVGVLIEDGEVV